MKQWKTIGVLGGMGPYATVYMYQCLLDEAHRQTHAIQDDEYPPILINSVSLKGSSDHGVPNTPIVRTTLVKGIKTLEQAGAEIIIMPCISAHSMYEALRSVATVPVLNLLDIVQSVFEQSMSKRVLLLSSDEGYTLLQQHLLRRKYLRIIVPNQQGQHAVTALIRGCMGGYVQRSVKDKVTSMIHTVVKERHIHDVILGCTELPLAITDIDSTIQLHDPVRIAAKLVIQRSYEGEKNI